MRVERLVEMIGADFYTGVPDSQLKSLCNYLMDMYGIDPEHHIIAANEGNCVSLAAGYYLATGRVPVVYLQNSGEGNIINPVASLLNEKVYGIPEIFIIGWRGEPGIPDEPQHIYQGEVTIRLLEDMGISSFVIGKNTSEEEVLEAMKRFEKQLAAGRDVAFVIGKGGLSYEKEMVFENEYQLTREEVIRHLVRYTGEDPIVSTTGKASRELFEIREANNQSHKYDFLTVGSMGHSSSIALGIAFNKPDTKIWCMDGDGAVLMHMGAMAVIGANAPKNMVHIVINNHAHETVGGMPTVAGSIDLTAIAKGCGYPRAVCVDTLEELDRELKRARDCQELCMVEVKCCLGARENLGRPTTTALENKQGFMDYLRESSISRTR
ncbi:MAG: phosphonopyruvate decarboxylase [Lachnospiraceae bacterium]|nr:phosphonopyruvate decarboxylase [Lachnospiraceae bacterium]